MKQRKRHYDKHDRKVATTGGNYVRHDEYWARAKDEGYAARSVYKLQEIHKERKVVGRGMRVVDLGCAPGSWMQWVGEQVGPTGRVVGVDLEKVDLPLPPHVTTLQMDMQKLGPTVLPPGSFPFDLLLSDVAPHTTGIRSVDQARAFDLSARAVLLCDTLLARGGALVVKTFEGPDTRRLADAIRKRFEEARTVRPKAVRKQSFELYLVGWGYRGAPADDPLAVL